MLKQNKANATKKRAMLLVTTVFSSRGYSGLFFLRAFLQSEIKKIGNCHLIKAKSIRLY